ncbi:MAG: hypothetical protein LUQ07_03430 [Methanospirillum sp.]|nr:hypothetical protein [Methanospirillum sp.]
MIEMRCISFAGAGIRERKRYCRETNGLVTDLVQEAIWALYQPEEIILCLSDPSAATIASELERRGVRLQKLWIPGGTDEGQLWEIFSIICGAVNDGEKILFDITAGCHSLPFITFLAASYLRSTRGISLSGIIYAPGCRDDGFCRFVDLRSLMHVLDWIAGVNAVNRSVDAEPLRDLLSGMQNSIHRRREDPDPPTHLTGWSTLLGQFCDAVRLARPVEAMYAASGVVKGIEPASNELSRYAPSLVRVIAGTSSLSGLAAEPEESCSYGYVRKQIVLIRYQVEKGLCLQAVTLGREVLITLFMIRMGKGDEWRDADARHQFSRTLTGGSLSLQHQDFERTRYSDDLTRITGWKELVRIWIRVSDLRNNLAHCGMNLRNDSIRSIKRQASDILPDIERFREICTSG